MTDVRFHHRQERSSTARSRRSGAVLRHEADHPTIGLILCQTKDEVLAEYALSGIDRPIGVSSYELTRALPQNLRSALPTVEEIEAELSSHEPKSQPKGKAVPPKRQRISTNKKHKSPQSSRRDS